MVTNRISIVLSTAFARDAVRWRWSIFGTRQCKGLTLEVACSRLARESMPCYPNLERGESTHMRTITISIFALTLAIGSALVAQDKGKGKGPAGPGLTLTSPAFADGAEIPPKYTQAEQNAPSPKLE